MYSGGSVTSGPSLSQTLLGMTDEQSDFRIG